MRSRGSFDLVLVLVLDFVLFIPVSQLGAAVNKANGRRRLKNQVKLRAYERENVEMIYRA